MTEDTDKIKLALGCLGAGIIIGGGAFYVYTQHSKPRATMPRNRSRPSITKESGLPASPSGVPPYMCARLARVMLPDDANPGGNIFGGTIMQMMGHAGWLAALKYVNATSGPVQDPENGRQVAIVFMNEIAFRHPIFVGDMAACDARVVSTSPHSIEVEVTVTAEGQTRPKPIMTNKCLLRFVGVEQPRIERRQIRQTSSRDIQKSLMKIVPMEYPSPQARAEGKARYEQHKVQRRNAMQTEANFGFEYMEWVERSLCERRHAPTVAVLGQVTFPSDCFGAQFLVDGGFMMKMMDSACGVVASRWCRSNVVTIGVDAIHFHTPVSSGEVVTCFARLISTSRRSLEIMAVSLAERNKEDLDGWDGESRGTSFVVTATAFFTFVSLNDEGRTQPVQPLNDDVFPLSDIEEKLFRLGEERYAKRKSRRKKRKK